MSQSRSRREAGGGDPIQPRGHSRPEDGCRQDDAGDGPASALRRPRRASQYSVPVARRRIGERRTRLRRGARAAPPGPARRCSGRDARRGRVPARRRGGRSGLRAPTAPEGFAVQCPGRETPDRRASDEAQKGRSRGASRARSTMFWTRCTTAALASAGMPSQAATAPPPPPSIRPRPTPT